MVDGVEKRSRLKMKDYGTVGTEGWKVTLPECHRYLCY
jgi:hypothetical protein